MNAFLLSIIIHALTVFSNTVFSDAVECLAMVLEKGFEQHILSTEECLETVCAFIQKVSTVSCSLPTLFHYLSPKTYSII